MVNSEIENPFKDFAKFNVDGRVFDWICKNMDKGNEIMIIQLDVAAELSCARQTVAISLRKLESSKHIVKIGKKHHHYIYLVNPNKVWRGDGKFQEACVAKFEKSLRQ